MNPSPSRDDAADPLPTPPPELAISGARTTIVTRLCKLDTGEIRAFERELTFDAQGLLSVGPERPGATFVLARRE